MAVIVSVLNKYFQRVTSRGKMPQICSEMSRNESYKNSPLFQQVKARTVFGQWFLDAPRTCVSIPYFKRFHSRPQSPSFPGHVVLRVLDFAHFGQESRMVFEGTTGVSLRRKRFPLLRHFSRGV